MGQQAASHVAQTVSEQSEAPAAALPNPIPLHEPESCSASDSSVTQSRIGLALSQESGLPREPPGGEATLGGSDSSFQPEVASPCTQLLDFQISAEEAALAQKTQSRDIDEILKEVIEEEREKASRAWKLAAGNQSEAELGVTISIFPLCTFKCALCCIPLDSYI